MPGHSGVLFPTKGRRIHQTPHSPENGVRVPATLAKKNVVGNVGFFKDGKVIPRRSSLKKLPSADIAVLKIMNQKNERMGKTITQHATGNAMRPSQSLARMVHHILSNGGIDNTLLCAHFAKGKWHTVESKAVVHMVCTTAKAMGLEKNRD